ncbi:hypothetical protein GCM10009119_30460 [Algoriphagus jejuensis]|uniref:HPt domain-containing protein n=1 Tax=Algoriphagus jejuensis TaxID=419934 RepID=A0ABN1N3B2_9BACT
MSNNLELNQRILDMAEGDDEFRSELISAIYTGLMELQTVYAQGRIEKDKVKIQQIRHKIKPTLVMFDFDQVAVSLEEGREILDAQGFGLAFESHFLSFLILMDLVLLDVKRLKE